jgi:drug/metabolite transporter (DMT)-like permease
MTTTTAPPLRLSNRPLLGILFMCGSATIFPIMNGTVQLMSASYTTEQLVWFRTAAHLLFVWALFTPHFGLGIVATKRPGTQIARSLVLLCSTTCFFFGVKHLPLANAASISFTAPFIVTLLAWPMLGERFGWHRMIAILIGFIGVLIVVRPGTAVFQWASMFIVASSSCYALYQVLTRMVAPYDRPETSAIYSVLVGAVAISAVMIFLLPDRWRWPDSSRDWAILLMLGVLGGLGHYCVAKALSYAPANVVAPFMYWQMVGSVIVGYVLAGHVPDAMTWLGAAVIIAAGLYIGWRETVKKVPVTPPAATP